jgi:hypothetical protein
MDCGRRTILLAGASLLGAVAAGEATACSLTATARRPFRRGACEREIEALVRLLNEAPSMAAEAVSDWYAERQFEIDRDLLTPDSEGLTDPVDFLRAFRLTDGKPDPRPIRLADLDLVRQRGNNAAFGFTLVRWSYHPADREGCDGLFTHGEYWGEERSGYIAAFQNNRLRSLREFPEWFADREA